MMRIAIPFLTTIFLVPGFVDATELPPPLEAAIADVEARRDAAAELRFTFEFHTVTSEHEFKLSYDPAKDEVWSVTGPANEQSDKMRERMAKRAESQESSPDRELLIDELRELIGARIELVDTSPKRLVYRFDLSEEAEIAGGSAKFDAAQYLTGEIAVGPEERILWLRFFAEEAFRPAMVAKINTFDLKLFFDPIWDDGPYVMVRQVMDLDGSAFFRSFSEKVNTVYSGFEKR